MHSKSRLRQPDGADSDDAVDPNSSGTTTEQKFNDDQRQLINIMQKMPIGDEAEYQDKDKRLPTI